MERWGSNDIYSGFWRAMKGREHNTDRPPPWPARSQRTPAGDHLHLAHRCQPNLLRSEGSGLRKFESRASLNTTGANESPAMASKFGSSFTVNKHKKVFLSSIQRIKILSY